MPKIAKPTKAKTKISRESELQKRLVELIEKDEFSGAIVGQEIIADLVSQRTSSDTFPVFSIDHLARISCAEAANHALGCLNHLEVLTDDLNVSLNKGEQLRPDVVCFNPENETLVLFELKKSGQAGREALTELIAYEQELKNHLPFRMHTRRAA